MNIRKTDDFLKGFEGLPAEVKNLYRRQERVFTRNWLDPRLHVKRIKGLSGAYSFRITRRYRAIFYFRDTEAIFFSIGHRKDIYR